MLLVYAEGGRSRSGKLKEVKPGIGRIALESGAPVVPVAIHGSEKVRRWKRLRFPKVTVQFGEPLSLPIEKAPSHERQLEAAEQIFAPVRGMYEELATRSGR
jgi:1-acyl-sn-glycerol-3-phosphate acyltransferase